MLAIAQLKNVLNLCLAGQRSLAPRRKFSAKCPARCFRRLRRARATTMIPAGQRRQTASA